MFLSSLHFFTLPSLIRPGEEEKSDLRWIPGKEGEIFTGAEKEMTSNSDDFFAFKCSRGLSFQPTWWLQEDDKASLLESLHEE